MDTISHNFFNNIFPNEILCIINNIIKKKIGYLICAICAGCLIVYNLNI